MVGHADLGGSEVPARAHRHVLVLLDHVPLHVVSAVGDDGPPVLWADSAAVMKYY